MQYKKVGKINLFGLDFEFLKIKQKYYISFNKSMR